MQKKVTCFHCISMQKIIQQCKQDSNESSFSKMLDHLFNSSLNLHVALSLQFFCISGQKLGNLHSVLIDDFLCILSRTVCIFLFRFLCFCPTPGFIEQGKSKKLGRYFCPIASDVLHLINLNKTDCRTGFLQRFFQTSVKGWVPVKKGAGCKLLRPKAIFGKKIFI